MADKLFTDADCIQQPTEVQKAIVSNHEDIGTYADIKYLKDGRTVLFKCSDGWVAVAPRLDLN